MTLLPADLRAEPLDRPPEGARAREPGEEEHALPAQRSEPERPRERAVEQLLGGVAGLHGPRAGRLAREGAEPLEGLGASAWSTRESQTSPARRSAEGGSRLGPAGSSRPFPKGLLASSRTTSRSRAELPVLEAVVEEEHVCPELRHGAPRQLGPAGAAEHRARRTACARAGPARPRPRRRRAAPAHRRRPPADRSGVAPYPRERIADAAAARLQPRGDRGGRGGLPGAADRQVADGDHRDACPRHDRHAMVVRRATQPPRPGRRAPRRAPAPARARARRETAGRRPTTSPPGGSSPQHLACGGNHRLGGEVGQAAVVPLRADLAAVVRARGAAQPERDRAPRRRRTPARDRRRAEERQDLRPHGGGEVDRPRVARDEELDAGERRGERVEREEGEVRVHAAAHRRPEGGERVAVARAAGQDDPRSRRAARASATAAKRSAGQRLVAQRAPGASATAGASSPRSASAASACAWPERAIFSAPGLADAQVGRGLGVEPRLVGAHQRRILPEEREQALAQRAPPERARCGAAAAAISALLTLFWRSSARSNRPRSREASCQADSSPSRPRTWTSAISGSPAEQRRVGGARHPLDARVREGAAQRLQQ